MNTEQEYASAFAQGSAMGSLLAATTAGGFVSLALLVTHLHLAFVASPTTSYSAERWITITVLAMVMISLNCLVLAACRRQGLIGKGR